MMKTLFFITFLYVLHLAVVAQNSCLPTRCDPMGPVIRFPFRLKGRQPEHCGHPGFDLSCTGDGRIKLDIQFPLTSSTNNAVLPLQTTVTVETIDYTTQRIRARNAIGRSCLPEKVPAMNTSTSPLIFEAEEIGYSGGHTLYNCSNARNYGTEVACLSGSGYQVIAFPSSYGITSLPPYSSCFKMYNTSYIPYSVLSGRDDEYGERFYLSWEKPSCGSCEEKGKFCKLKNGGHDEIECFKPQHGQGASRNKKSLIAGIAVGSILLLFIAIASYFFLIKIKKKYKDHKNIEKILKNHKNMKPTRYSYAQVKRITNNFTEELGTFHKGKLTDQKFVAIKMLNASEQNAEDFINEVEQIGELQHGNVLKLVGFCVDGQKKALVYEFPPNGILENIQNQIAWDKLNQIAIGIAKGIDYVHQIPSSVFLDENLDPKICIARVEDVFHKEDVYSFGVLLMDMVRRRRNFRENGGSDYPLWVYDETRFGDEQVIKIDEDEEEEEEEKNEIYKKVCIVGLWCMQWFPCDRPSMKEVIRMLEGDEMPLMPSNPFKSVDFKKQK